MTTVTARSSNSAVTALCAVCVATIVLSSTQLLADDRAIGLAPAAKTTSGGQRWALVVGINEYASLPRLRYARQDAEAIAEALVKQCGFPKTNVVLMTDSAQLRADDFPRYPTRGNLRSRINQLATIAGRNDLLLICFSGHGLNVDGNGYLAPIDGAGNDLGSLVPLTWVRTTLETSPASQRLLILDACHSSARSGPGDSPAAAVLSPLAGAAFVTLASCDSRQLSHEEQKLGHGVFSAAVVEGLGGAADRFAEGNRDGTVTANELFAFSSLRVKQWCLESGKTQTPVLKGEMRGRVELVRFGKVRREPISLPQAPPATPAPRVQRSAPKHGDTFTNSIGMKLVYIRPGEFMMGSPANEEGRRENERQHHVRLTQGFWMGVTDVTQAQWKAVMGSNPSKFKGDNLPVNTVSWNDAVAFCRKLSTRERTTYRLPTEAKWEYACRAGSTGRFSFGDNDADLHRHGNYCDRSNTNGFRWQDKHHDDGHDKTSPGGSFLPNAWGLFDMHGNVLEWCADWFGDYPNRLISDPTGPGTGKHRVLRGGSWSHYPWNCRSAYRGRDTPGTRHGRFGFRVVCSVRPGLAR